MSVFDRVSDKQVQEAQYFERGVYVKPGRFVGEILKVKEGTMRAPKNTGFLVVELKVLESSDTKEHPVGSIMTWMTTADKDAFLGNVKHFIAAAGNVKDTDVTVEDMKTAVSEDNPLQGIVLQVDAVGITTKAGLPFTKVRFTYLRDGSVVEEARAS